MWRGNGDALAKIVGDVILREAASPLRPLATQGKPKFLGYRLERGLPTFRYRLGRVTVQERLTPAPDGPALLRRFVLTDAPDVVQLRLAGGEHVRYRSADGTFDGPMFTPREDKRLDFVVRMNLELPTEEAR